MTLRDLALRSLRHHWRSHAAVLAGATVAAAVLVGALAVGDSVRESLAQRVRERLGLRVATALDLRDRFVTTNLAVALTAQFPNLSGSMVNAGGLFGIPPVAGTALVLPATASRSDGGARANGIRMYGVTPAFLDLVAWRPEIPNDGEVWLAEPLVRQLQAKVGDEVLFRIHKPSALSRDAVITPRDDQSVALRLRVARVIGASDGAFFGLQADQAPPLNAWVSHDPLARVAGLPGLANLVVAQPPGRMREPYAIEQWIFRLKEIVRTGWTLGKEARISATGRIIPAREATEALSGVLSNAWSLADVELALRPAAGGASTPAPVELVTRRIFLEPAVVSAALGAGTNGATPTPVITYLVNSIRQGDRLTPYSMVTAAGHPYTPADLKDDEIVVNEWLARDLGVKPGDAMELAYYRADAGAHLVELTNTFRIHSVVPLSGLHADRTLMPEFPGLTKAESTRDWDAGFDLVHPIRDQDEAYWKQWRGTPKAFISLKVGQKLWANRFGDLTAVRWIVPDGASLESTRAAVAAQIRERLNPAEVGLVWQPVAERARIAATTGQDFGGLFLGFSFFLIVSALLLTSMLFQFALERRTSEVGVLLAIGWDARQVRRLLLREGMMLAGLGTLLGTVVGVAYAKGILWGLSTVWRDAVAGAGLQFHLTATTLLTGALLGFGVATGTLWMALRGQARRPARELLNEGGVEMPALPGTGAVRWNVLIAAGCGLAALGLATAGWIARESQQPGLFFGAGALALASGSLGLRAWFRRRPGAAGRSGPRSVGALAMRGLTRRPSRSMATVLLLASAAFLLVVVAANRLDAGRQATDRGSGTGGFTLWGESTLPITQDLSTAKGQEFYGLDPKELSEVSVVSFRVRDGDDASCLNLNRAQQPRLLGVDPAALAQRGAFTFTAIARGTTVTNGWLALNPGVPASAAEIPEFPAIGDANSIQWAMGKKVGDTLDFMDERGRPFRLRLVGAVANSILQGSLVVSQEALARLYPSDSGYRVFLVDAPATNATALSALLTRALSDTGLQMTPTTDRLARFNAVQNTYLNTFQILGGLGLLLGSVGLGVVVLRTVQERRGELALMQAVGFERKTIRRLVLTEHLVLLFLGLALGVVSAVVAVLPTVLRPGSGIPWTSLAVTLLVVGVNGSAWTAIATQRALRGDLLSGLREL
jgi:putative ABC transport system permease protein